MFFDINRIKKTLSNRAKEIFIDNQDQEIETCLTEPFYSSKQFESRDYPGKYYKLVFITSSKNDTSVWLVIDMYTGQTLKDTVTMECYGFLQTGSDSYCELSYEETNKILMEKEFSFPQGCTEINENNWQKFISASEWEKKTQWDKQHKLYNPDKPICVKGEELIYDKKYSMCNSFIDFNQRFGCSYLYLRKTNKGYRLFCGTAACMQTPHIYGISNPPTEQEILQVVSKSHEKYKFYDRLLNDVEISYYLHTLQMKMSIKNKILINDIYSSTFVKASLNGKLYDKSSKFIWDMHSTMQDIAERGIIVK